MSFLMIMGAASMLPVVAISAEDERLDGPRTFVSPNAEAALEAGDGEVYCLDRSRSDRYRSICLTGAEWQQAIALAESDPKPGPRAIIPGSDGGTATGSSAQIYGRSL